MPHLHVPCRHPPKLNYQKRQLNYYLVSSSCLSFESMRTWDFMTATRVKYVFFKKKPISDPKQFLTMDVFDLINSFHVPQFSEIFLMPLLSATNNEKGLRSRRRSASKQELNVSSLSPSRKPCYCSRKKTGFTSRTYRQVFTPSN